MAGRSRNSYTLEATGNLARGARGRGAAVMVSASVLVLAVAMASCSSSSTNNDLFAATNTDKKSPAGTTDTPAGGCLLGCGNHADGGLKPHDPGADGGDQASDVAAPTVDPASLLDGRCMRATATRPPAYMLIVLDGSGSMTEANKWSSAVAALDAVFDDLAATSDPALGVGLMVFSDSSDPTMGVGPYPTSRDVTIAYVEQGQHDALRGRIDGSNAQNATPTLAALNGGYHMLENFIPAAPLPRGGRKVVVLMTDGNPNGGAQEQASVIDAATTELGRGITTFAVGIGAFPSTDPSVYDAAFMGRLAQAGGAAPAGCNPTETSNPLNLCHFQITPGAKSVQQLKLELVDAFNRIRKDVVSCEFGIGGAIDPSHFNVVLQPGVGGASVVPKNAQTGWVFDDDLSPTKVILEGAACDALKLDPKASVSFLTGCATYAH